MSAIMKSLAVVLLLSSGSAFAETADQAAVAGLLHGQFDKPGATLRVAPVVISGDHAIAGWEQSEMGGRALLRRKAGGWTIVLCAGDAIKARDALAKAGVPGADAARLEAELAKAETTLDPATVTKFSRFEGLVMMDQHGAHPGHGSSLHAD